MLLALQHHDKIDSGTCLATWQHSILFLLPDIRRIFGGNNKISCEPGGAHSHDAGTAFDLTFGASFDAPLFDLAVKLSSV